MIFFILVLIIKRKVLLTTPHHIIIPFSVLIYITIWLIVLILILVFIFQIVLFVCVQTMCIFPNIKILWILILKYLLFRIIFLISQNILISLVFISTYNLLLLQLLNVLHVVSLNLKFLLLFKKIFLKTRNFGEIFRITRRLGKILTKI